MNKKEFILKLVDLIFTTFCFLVIICICFFCGFAFGLDCKSIDNLSNEAGTSSVSALSVQPLDTSIPNYQFTSSNFPFLIYDDINGTEHDFIAYCPTVFTIGSDFFTFYSYRFDATDVSYTFSPDSSGYFKLVYDENRRVDFRAGISHIAVSFEYYYDSNFDRNPVKFEVGALDSYFGDSDYYDSYIRFIDSNGYFFQFGWRVSKEYLDTELNIGEFILSPRTYYYYSSFDNDGLYQQGYETGYQNGVIAGEDTGYTNGYSNGYDDGLIDGYDNGVISANDYSFSSLLTSVVGAPVTVFTDLLDFNIMGYSLLNIVMGLLTLGLVVLIIKLCLGGK